MEGLISVLNPLLVLLIVKKIQCFARLNSDSPRSRPHLPLDSLRTVQGILNCRSRRQSALTWEVSYLPIISKNHAEPPSKSLSQLAPDIESKHELC